MLTTPAEAMDTKLEKHMSGTNGTASATSVNGTTAVAIGGGSGRPGDYVAGIEDTAPMDRVDDPRFEDAQREKNPRAVVEALSMRVEVAKDLTRLQSSGELFEHLDPDEVDVERAVLRLKRAKDRELRTWQAERNLRREKKAVKRAQRRAHRAELRESITGWMDRRFKRRDERDAASDARWHQRAQRVQQRLTSTNARIAAQIRSATRWSNALIWLMFGGMAYTGFVVQRNFVPGGDKTDPLFWLSLLLEAMASMALMALMRFDAREALAGIKRDGKAAFHGWLVKGGLLVASLAAAAGPAIKDGDLGDMVRTGWAPVLVAAVLLIHDRIARGDSEILVRLARDVDAERLRELVVKAEFAVEAGLLAPSQDNKQGEVAPSASKIASYFRVSKTDAAHVRAEVNARASALV